MYFKYSNIGYFVIIMDMWRSFHECNRFSRFLAAFYNLADGDFPLYLLQLLQENTKPDNTNQD